MEKRKKFECLSSFPRPPFCLAAASADLFFPSLNPRSPLNSPLSSYSDFVVNEIDGSGRVVVLRQMGRASAAAADAAAAARAALADSSAVEAALLKRPRAEREGAAPADDGGGGGASSAPNLSSSSSSLEALLASLVALTSEEDARKVREFLKSVTSDGGDGDDGKGDSGRNQQQQQRTLVLSPSRDKASRGAVHAWFREAARALGSELASRGALETTTTTAAAAAATATTAGEGAASSSSSCVCVVFTPFGCGSGRGGGNSRGGGRGGARGGTKRGRDGDGEGTAAAAAASLQRNSRQRPPLPAAFCHFTLEKTNLDTAAALQEIAVRCWGGGGGGGGGGRGGRGGGRGRGSRQQHRPVSSAALSVAGTKDKRGVTFQRVSARRTAAPRLAAAAAGVRGVRVGDFSYEAEGLRLGDGRGNRFTIALRGLRGAGSGDDGDDGDGDGDGK